MLVDHHTVVETPMTTTLPDPRPGCPASVYLRKAELGPVNAEIERNAKAASEAYAKFYVPPAEVGREEMLAKLGMMEKLYRESLGTFASEIDFFSAIRALISSAPSAELQEVTREYLEMTKDEYAMCDERHECSQCGCRRRLIAAVEKAEKEGR